MTEMNKSAYTAALLLTTIIFTGSAAASPLQMNLFPNEGSTRIDSSTSFELELTNTGTTLDRYTLSSSSREEITLAPDRISLEPGEQTTVTVFYDPSQSKKQGLYEYRISAQSEATTTYYNTDLPVEVITDHEVSITPESSNIVRCIENGAAETTFQVENKGIQNEGFNLRTSHGTINKKQVRLRDSGTETVTATLPARQTGQTTVNLVAESMISYASAEESISYTVEDCFNTQLEQKEITVPAGTTTETDIEITNSGTRGNTFSLSADQDNIDVPETVSVESSQTEQIPVTVSPQELGTRTFTLEAKGISSTTTQQYSVTSENRMSSQTSVSGPSSVCQEQPRSFEAQITNNGAAQESFNLSTSTGKTEKTSMNLEPGEAETVEVSLPEDIDTGNNTIEVSSTAQSFSRPESSDSKNFRVEDCFNGQITVTPKDAEAGSNRSAVYNIQVKNTGTQPNSFNLSHNGPRWVKIQPKALSIEPGLEANTSMYAAIPSTVSQESFSITAEAEGTGVQVSETVSLFNENATSEENTQNSVLSGSFTSGNAGTPLTLVLSIIGGLLISTALLRS